MKYNRRQFIGYSLSALTVSLLLKACGGSSDSPTTESDAKAFKMAIVLPGSITDGGWNQSGYEGVKKSAENLNAEMAYLEQVEPANQAEALSGFARQGYNLVIAHGGQFDAAIEQVSGQFTETFFLAVNGNIAGENYASVTTNYLQLAYLAGAIAALMSQNNKVAFITGLSFKSTDAQAKAFELGARSINPNIETVNSFTGDFNDIAKAKEATLALISTGVDVIYHNLDNSSPAVLETASEKGIYAIGNVSNQLEIAPEAVLTSTLQDIGGAIGYVANLVHENQVEPEKYMLGLEHPEIVKLGKFNPIIPDMVKEKVNRIEQSMLTENLTFQDCVEGGEETVCLQETI
ncbi:MAG: BMP family protein [Lyngbya sp.]|nr:BMP family protein [Lyngbya sp.]